MFSKGDKYGIKSGDKVILKPRYSTILPGDSGIFALTDGKGYFRIDRSFQALGKGRYVSIGEVWKGEYYVVEKGPFNKGLMDKAQVKTKAAKKK